MPIKTETDPWVGSFRDLLKASIADGDQWFVTNYKGKMRLQVKVDGKVSTRILPFDWSKSGAAKALPYIQQIYNRYSLA